MVAMNPDGTGLTALNILSRVWSTTRWVAARTYSDFFSPKDVSIRIIRLPTREPVRTIRLLSKDLATQVEENEDWDPNLAPDVYQAVLTDRPTMRWSPDGRYLAFIAAKDGPSADLYVYDMQTDQVSRLTDGPNQAVLMDWSLDGKWIIHMEATDFFTGEGGFAWHISPKAVWAASVDGSEVKKLYDVEGDVEVLMGWRAPSVFVVLSSHGSSPPSGLRSVDVNSGRIFTLDNRDITRVAADWKTGTVAYVVEHVGPEGVEMGLFLIQPGWATSIRLDTGGWGLPHWVEWFPETGLFYADFPRGTIIFTSSGEVLERIEAECIPFPSPDGQWLAFGRWECPYDSESQDGLRLYTTDGEFVRQLSTERVSRPIWKPDSTGIFFNVRTPIGDDYLLRFMYAPLPEGEPWVVHPNPGASFFAWMEP
jgi:dipeptidyl aminopeptidase/acylaminoacyl peptidase